MSTWFAKNTTLDPADPAAHLGAYKQGRQDERIAEEKAAVDARVPKAELDKAYERGLRDARSRRRGSPLGMLLLLILVVAAVAIFMVYQYGSFTGAGKAADTAITSTAQHAAAPVHQAADKAGTALENAGQDLKQTAGSDAGKTPAQSQ